MRLSDYQAVVDLTSEALGIATIEVKIKNVLGGRSLPHSITLPLWLHDYDEAYGIYYAVHETVHYLRYSVPGLRGHNDIFKEKEDKALALWGLRIVRKKAYPKYLYDNGKRINNIL